MDQNVKVFITRRIYTVLCPEGLALREKWLESLNEHEAPEVIYKAMQAYFTHKNGVLGKKSKQANFCRVCGSWMVKE